MNEAPGPLAPQQKPGAKRVLAWMCVLVGVNQLGFGVVVPVLPLYAQSFGVPQTAIGLTVAIYGLARVLLSIPAAQVADRLGRRSALAIGGGLGALGNVWCALADTYVELVLARFVAGAGAGVVLTSGIIVLADITRPANRGRAMGIYQGVFLFAACFGPFPGGFLAEHLGLDAPFLACGAAAALAAAVGWFGVAETRGFAIRAPGPEARPPLLRQLRALAHGGLVLAGLVGLVAAVARTGALFSVVPILAHERLGLPVGAIGVGLALGSVAGLAVAYPAGAVADRHGRKVVIVCATLVTGLSMLGFGWAAGYPGFLLACLIWGAATAAAGAAPAAYAADSAPPGMNAAAMSSYRMVSDVGYVAGPLLLGLLADWGGLDVPFWLAAALLFLIAVLFWRFAPERRA